MGDEKYRPGIPDLIFGIVLTLALLGGRRALLNDPGTFWHVQLGRQILETGSLPRVDTFTFTRAGDPWIDMAWLADIGMARIVALLGWPGLVLASALILAWIYRSLSCWLIEEGASPWAAGLATCVAAGVGACHFLARPHLLTIAGALYTFRACRRFHQGKGRWPLIALPGVVWAWSAIHGAFLIGPLIIAASTLGEAVSGPWDRDRARRVGAFVAIGSLCLLTPLAGPYGFELYRHFARVTLTSRITDLVVEHQPASFADPDTRLLEGLVLALIALPSLTGRRVGRFDLVLVLIWFHQGMATIRNAPIFAIAAAPALANLIDGLLTPEPIPPWLVRSRTIAPAWITAILLLAAYLGVPFGSYDRSRWPMDTLQVLDRQPRDARLFHDLEWGGLIEARSEPRRPAFIDDRFELFGREAVLEYMASLQGGPAWDRLDGKEHFDLAWLRIGTPLADRLARDGWTELARDGAGILLRRGPASWSLAERAE
ncbi:MAG: hypothetical protein U0800_24090 [Isosphaeraceae bacterium]